MKLGKTLFSANLEVTRRCNLRCVFCDYWKPKDEPAELADYTPVIRHLDPLSLSITGGEPLLRRDMEGVIRAIRNGTRFVYMNLITNGSLLSPDRAQTLRQAGLNQLTVSLDFPDARHDAFRGRNGLWRHLKDLLPALVRSGIDNVCLNTVIMKENMADLLPMARMARTWGLKISYSTYNPHKIDNPDHLIPSEAVASLARITASLIAWKRKYGNITNSDYYLRNVSRYFQDGRITGCLAGRKWVQIRPDGTLRRCSDREVLGDWRNFRPNRVPFSTCHHCWYACRGEAEAPLGIRRIIELHRSR